MCFHFFNLNGHRNRSSWKLHSTYPERFFYEDFEYGNGFTRKWLIKLKLIFQNQLSETSRKKPRQSDNYNPREILTSNQCCGTRPCHSARVIFTLATFTFVCGEVVKIYTYLVGIARSSNNTACRHFAFYCKLWVGNTKFEQTYCEDKTDRRR